MLQIFQIFGNRWIC